jgi:solute carrier family 15 oligopeptide transporter 1
LVLLFGSRLIYLHNYFFKMFHAFICFICREIAIVGLLLIAFGTGGIKPCVAAFGGDQFKLPQQERQLQQFFSVFYFSINSGSLISTFVTPILRQDVKCFDQNTCYPLAFGVPAVLMIVALSKYELGKIYSFTAHTICKYILVLELQY